MERIRTDASDFEELRTSGATYVDKTGIIKKLVDKSVGNQFFLARPRRFGKSLLLSTIRYLFEGRRDLFEGLAIAGTDWDFEGEACTVVRLDLSNCEGDMGRVEQSTLSALVAAAEDAGLALRRDMEGPGEMLRFLIRDAAAKSPTGKCVVLVDEYDKPLVPHLGTPGVRPFQDYLRTLYTPIKSTGEFQRFCLMTGVSKFSKVSIFSSLNNLVDLTMHPLSTTLLGYTHQEVLDNFPGALEALGEAHGISKDRAFQAIVDWYDGYCFDKRMVRVFNPVSLGRALADSEIKSYWFETGTPEWLMSYARREPMNVEDVELAEDDLGSYDPADPDMQSVLFQSGYLTITEVIGEELAPPTYRLGFPNREVEQGFSRWLANAYSSAGAVKLSSWRLGCLRAVREGDASAFVSSLKSLFASIGYDTSDRLSEQAYQYVACAIMRFVGADVSTEEASSQGRADMVCRSKGHVFVIELKVATGDAANGRAARDAIAQIRERGYAEPYRADAEAGKRGVQLLGISFDCGTHNIAAWECEAL